MTKIPVNPIANEIGIILTGAQEWFKRTFVDVFRQLRWSFLPPLMVYFAAGISGLIAIVGTFFVKEYLGLSAAFLSALTFWAGLPWALKMPLGHLVDLVWPWKALLVYLGAALIAASLSIMYALIMHTEAMRQLLSVGGWFVVSSLLAPAGYVVQDTVADAMTVEAVPRADADGQPLSEEETKALHTTMQTLGRIALIGGLVFVALLNIVMFAGVEGLEQSQKADVYARIYLMALAIPLMSVSGVVLSQVMLASRAKQLRAQWVKADKVDRLVYSPGQSTKPDYWIFGGRGHVQAPDIHRGAPLSSAARHATIWESNIAAMDALMARTDTRQGALAFRLDGLNLIKLNAPDQARAAIVTDQPNG